MARIFSHPFQIGANGSVRTVEQTSDEANAQQIAVLALTRYGERPMVPTFGISDPLFDEFRPAELSAGIALFGPPVELTSINVESKEDNTLLIDVRFD
jgi:hypothetical protein